MKVDFQISSANHGFILSSMRSWSFSNNYVPKPGAWEQAFLPFQKAKVLQYFSCCVT
jgi:hypothetical protein